MMKALITGASSGIGADIAKILANKGYDVILVARDIKKLEKIKRKIKTRVEIISLDISTTANCVKLYNQVNNEDIDILVNNAGFGIFGKFVDTNLDQELNLIDLNIKAVHTLTKLFLKDFKKKNRGYILNVSSTAAFSPGPLMATYFASKAYVLRLTEAIYEELKEENSNVYIGTLCPGPVNTNFNKNLGIKFSTKALESYDVANYAIEQMFKKQMLIIPSFSLKMNYFFNKFIPTKLLLKANYNVQIKKAIKNKH